MGGFGMGGFGMGGGMGGRNSNMRKVRLLAFVAVILAGFLLGRHGTGYEVIRWCYYGILIGGITYSISRRRARGRMGPGPGQGPMMGGGFGGAGQGMPNSGMSNPAMHNTMQAPPPMPGWYPEGTSAATQRYWDGVAWGARRQWNGTGWVAAE